MKFKDVAQLENWLRDTKAGRKIIKAATTAAEIATDERWKEIVAQCSYTKVKPLVLLFYSDGSVELYGDKRRFSVRRYKPRTENPGRVVEASVCEKRPAIPQLVETEPELIWKGKVER